MDIHVVIVHNDLPKRWSNHRYEVHPIGGEIEETHHGYTCSKVIFGQLSERCSQEVSSDSWQKKKRSKNSSKIRQLAIAVLNKSETVLGCKSK